MTGMALATACCHEAQRKPGLFFCTGPSGRNKLGPRATLNGYAECNEHDAEDQDWTEALHQGRKDLPPGQPCRCRRGVGDDQGRL